MGLSVSSLWSPVVAQLDPYVPGEQPRIEGLVKLNTNENPYPPSPKAVAAIQSAAALGLELYPDPCAHMLRGTVARHHGLAPDQVFVGNGSDEVLAHAFFAFFQHGLPVVMPDVTYSFYRVYCRLYGLPTQTVALNDRMQVELPALLSAVEAGCSGVVVANPNAPTGIALPLAALEQILQACPSRVVLVDEAYVDFGADSAVGLIPRYPQLLVVHTLSKSRSLAGLRVGVAMGQRPLIEALERVKDSFNSYPLDRLALAGAQAAYEDVDYFEATRRAVMNSREGLALALEDLGFEVLPSSANFLFVRHPRRDAASLAAELRQRAILVRHFRTPERIDSYLRISIGTPAQCSALVAALQAVLLHHS